MKTRHSVTLLLLLSADFVDRLVHKEDSDAQLAGVGGLCRSGIHKGFRGTASLQSFRVLHGIE